MDTQTHSQTIATLSCSVDASAAAPTSAGTEALLFKDDPQFWFEIERLFGAAEYSAALFGEVIAMNG